MIQKYPVVSCQGLIAQFKPPLEAKSFPDDPYMLSLVVASHLAHKDGTIGPLEHKEAEVAQSLDLGQLDDQRATRVQQALTRILPDHSVVVCNNI